MKVCSFLSSPNRGWLLLLPSPRISGSSPGRVAFLLLSQSLRLLLHMGGSAMQAGLPAYALPKRALSDPLLCSNLCHKQSVEAHGKELENECVLSLGLDLPSSLNCPFNTQLTCKNLFFTYPLLHWQMRFPSSTVPKMKQFMHPISLQRGLLLFQI